ncbi:hypothetical protein [Chryseobacterium sp. SIMBA_029]|uniref:hypothetical protein n=1 Tax=Chryseobacterium sp. SIMBA_029 TaxID=3085772 RepID=UPI00397CC6E7
MKKTALFIFMLITSMMYSQTNSIQIINFSPYNVKFTLQGNDKVAPTIDCVPWVYNQDPIALSPGQSITYSQYNSTHLTALPINAWKVYAPDGTHITYDLTTGMSVPTAISGTTSWALINIFTPAGEQLQLGRSCTGNDGPYTTPPGSSITATWNTLNGNVLVVITQ